MIVYAFFGTSRPLSVSTTSTIAMLTAAALLNVTQSSDPYDYIVPAATLAFLVGVFLLLGLFTRFWSIVGAGFLFSVISSQWPGWPGAEPTYYQSIELVALLVIFSTAAGRLAGLDFFIDLLWRRCCPPKTEKKA